MENVWQSIYFTVSTDIPDLFYCISFDYANKTFNPNPTCIISL